MKILGIQDGHTSSATLIEDGQVLAAIQEERLTREKNQGGFPEQAVREVMQIVGWGYDELDGAAICGMGTTRMTSRDGVIAAYRKHFDQTTTSPWKRGERRLRTFWRACLGDSGHSSRKEKRGDERRGERSARLVELGLPRERIRFIDHHLCHAASAFYGQGSQDHPTLVLTCDGHGDGVSASVRKGQDGALELLHEVPADRSVGALYSFVTHLLGFIPLEHEYKLMGMAPYAEGAAGAREVCDWFHGLIAKIDPNSLGWEKAAGLSHFDHVPPLMREAFCYRRFDHIAAGVQLFLEEFLLDWVRRAIQITGIPHLALAGGSFMNVKLNKLILELPEVESVYIFPSCGDESNSFGAAWMLYADLLREQNRPVEIPRLGAMYLGRAFSDDDALSAIEQFSFNKQYKVTPLDDIEKRCAELIAAGEVVARCKGRMEFGARSLGNRSILADPGNWGTIHTINSMIKKRDFWMPFAPSMLAEQADRYLVNPKQAHAPYMIMAFDSQPAESTEIVAATHPYDHTCRPQVVEQQWAPDYHRLISHYHELTGKGAVLNTSFNLHGWPVVNTPKDALEVFDSSGLRYLALGNLLVEEIVDG